MMISWQQPTKFMTLSRYVLWESKWQFLKAFVHEPHLSFMGLKKNDLKFREYTSEMTFNLAII